MSDALCADPGRDPRDWDPMDASEAGKQAGNRSYSLPRIQRAIAVCHFCPIKRECLQHALDTEQQGVWGGRYLSRETLRKRGVAA